MSNILLSRLNHCELEWSLGQVYKHPLKAHNVPCTVLGPQRWRQHQSSPRRPSCRDETHDHCIMWWPTANPHQRSSIFQGTKHREHDKQLRIIEADVEGGGRRSNRWRWKAGRDQLLEVLVWNAKKAWNVSFRQCETMENVQTGEKQSDVFLNTAVWRIDVIDTTV